MAELKILLGARIYELRNRKKLTQAQFAELADISTDTISRIERGVRSPSFVVLDRMARALNLEVYEFFNFSNKQIYNDNLSLELIDLLHYFRESKPEEIKKVLKIAKIIFE